MFSYNVLFLSYKLASIFIQIENVVVEGINPGNHCEYCGNIFGVCCSQLAVGYISRGWILLFLICKSYDGDVAEYINKYVN